MFQIQIQNEFTDILERFLNMGFSVYLCVVILKDYITEGNFKTRGKVVKLNIILIN